jgi:hypothetical protein
MSVSEELFYFFSILFSYYIIKRPEKQIKISTMSQTFLFRKVCQTFLVWSIAQNVCVKTHIRDFVLES